MVSGTAWVQETDPAKEIADYWRAEQAQRESRQARLDTLMSTMAEEMEAIRHTSDQGERQALMVTHRENMLEAMQLMRNMGGAHLQEVVAGHLGSDVGSDSKHTHGMPARAREHMSDSARLGDLENRVDMMQIMIESIVGEQAKH
jgi:uncharacterized protein YicC (UPF0701 family)